MKSFENYSICTYTSYIVELNFIFFHLIFTYICIFFFIDNKYFILYTPVKTIIKNKSIRITSRINTVITTSLDLRSKHLSLDTDIFVFFSPGVFNLILPAENNKYKQFKTYSQIESILWTSSTLKKNEINS